MQCLLFLVSVAGTTGMNMRVKNNMQHFHCQAILNKEQPMVFVFFIYFLYLVVIFVMFFFQFYIYYIYFCSPSYTRNERLSFDSKTVCL